MAHSPLHSNEASESYLEPSQPANFAANSKFESNFDNKQRLSDANDENAASKKGYRPVSLMTDNKYEELPGYRALQHNAKDKNGIPPALPLSPPPSSLPSSGLTTGSADSQDRLWRANSKLRKRFNPLFDNRDSDKSAMTASVVSSKADKNCMLPVWCVLHAIIASIAIAALVIAALTRTQCMNTTPISSPIIIFDTATTPLLPSPQASSVNINEQLLNQTNTLRLQYEDLLLKQQQLMMLISELTSNDSYTSESLSKLIQSLSSMNSSLYEQIMKVSKMPGPPGAGNLSACFYKELSRGSSSIVIPSTSSTIQPQTLQDALLNVMMGVACSTIGGNSSNLNVLTQTDWPAGMNQKYQCTCFGQSDPSVLNRVCILHGWLCPRIS